MYFLFEIGNLLFMSGLFVRDGNFLFEISDFYSRLNIFLDPGMVTSWGRGIVLLGDLFSGLIPWEMSMKATATYVG